MWSETGAHLLREPPGEVIEANVLSQSLTVSAMLCRISCGVDHGERRLGRGENSQITLNAYHRQELSLESSIGRAPVFIVIVPNISFLEGSRRFKRDVLKMPELSLRLSKSMLTLTLPSRATR